MYNCQIYTSGGCLYQLVIENSLPALKMIKMIILQQRNNFLFFVVVDRLDWLVVWLMIEIHPEVFVVVVIDLKTNNIIDFIHRKKHPNKKIKFE